MQTNHTPKLGLEGKLAELLPRRQPRSIPQVFYIQHHYFTALLGHTVHLLPF